MDKVYDCYILILFRLYRLAYPNGEVRYGFTESLLPALNKHIIW